MAKRVTSASAAASALVAQRRDRGGSGGRAAASERLTEAKAAREELRLARERGELLPADEVLAAWQGMIGACRARLLSIPTKAAPLVVGEPDAARVQALLRDLVHEALNELADMQVEVVDEGAT